MDIVALVISLLSLIVAGVGTYQSNKRAGEALAEARRSAAEARWSAVQEAVQHLIGFDPTAEPVGDRLANLRITMIALVDELGEWDGLDAWLEAERTLGATLGRQVMDAAKPGDTVEQRLANLDPLMRWALALSSNLRRFRSIGHDVQTLSKLQSHAEDLAITVHERHGWNLPPRTQTGIESLESRSRSQGRVLRSSRPNANTPALPSGH